MNFRIIHADCPWRYSFQRIKKNGGCTYPTMSTQELCELPVSKIVAKDAVLFLWATYPKLKDAIEVMEAWGFTYKTNGFTWIKTNKKNGELYSGTGSYTCGNSEVCLIGRKGKGLQRINKSVKQVVISPIGKHSEKPVEVRQRIEQIYGNVPRVELFARKSCIGWLCLGDEIDGKDIRDALGEIIKNIEQRPNLMMQRRRIRCA